MAWTEVSSVSETGASDNGSFAGPTTSIGGYVLGGPAQNGDLIIIVAEYKGSGTLSITGSSQTWNALTQGADGTSLIGKIFWCQYNSSLGEGGTCGVASGTNALTVIAYIFRPTLASNTIAIDVTQATSSYAAPASPFTVTITGISTVAASTLSFAVWMSEDDNTWGTLSGTGWVKPAGFAQWRNLTGTDMSLTAAFIIQSSAAATGNVSQNQATNGGDAGIKFIVAWSETAAAASATKFLMLMGVGT